MKKLVIILTLFSYFSSWGQNFVLDFENLQIPDTGFWNGSDPSIYNGGFGNQHIFLHNSYNSQWDYWEGFSFSNWTDTITNSYTNQWSCYAGTAHSGQIFALGYVPIDFYSGNYPTIPININFTRPLKIDSLFLTNSTFTAKTIKEGSNFNQPFSDGDFYLIRIYAIKNTDTLDTIEVYLADYRNGQTFIAKNWIKVDFSHLNDSLTALSFDAYTTDVGQWGPNTPLYFCLDDIYYSIKSNTTFENSLTASNIKIYPNPAKNFFYINEDCRKIELFSIDGKKILEIHSYSANTPIYIQQSNYSTFVVRITKENAQKTAILLKN